MMLSIIIPIFNCEKYIADCIDSCLSQGISSEEYEIICVDDCSTDESYAIISKFAEKYNNVVVLRHEKNSGVSAARNTGMETMQGEFCWFIDGDDFIANNCLAQIIQILNSGCDVLSIGRATFHNEENRARFYYKDKIKYNGVGLAGYITSRIIKSALIKNLRFRINVAYGEDEIFYFEIMQQKPLIEVLDCPIYYYRLHSESVMCLNTEKRLKRIASVEHSMEYMAEKYTCDNPDAAKFIDQRVEIALGDIAKLGALQRVRELHTLKKVTSEIHLPISGRNLNRQYFNKRKNIIYQHLIENRFFRTVYHRVKRKKVR